jgi:sporulation protein YlmC with PRC-barrel domain
MKLTTASSVAVLAIASALALPPGAQGQGAQPDQKAPPTQAQGQGGQKDQAAAIPARQRDTVLVSNLLNASVYGPNDSTIGEIEDILIKSDGKIEGLVVSVGGFLGLGEKNVALKMDRFKVMPQADGRARITVSATEDELRKAPAFQTKQAKAS